LWLLAHNQRRLAFRREFCVIIKKFQVTPPFG